MKGMDFKDDLRKSELNIKGALEDQFTELSIYLEDKGFDGLFRCVRGDFTGRWFPLDFISLYFFEILHQLKIEELFPLSLHTDSILEDREGYRAECAFQLSYSDGKHCFEISNITIDYLKNDQKLMESISIPIGLNKDIPTRRQVNEIVDKKLAEVLSTEQKPGKSIASLKQLKAKRRFKL